MMLTAAIFIIILLLQYGYSEECPSPENIRPCSCKTGENGIHVVCNHIESLEELNYIMNEFQSHDIHYFLITDSTFEYVPNYLFENVTVKELNIKNSNFSRLGNVGEPQFKGLEDSLETLRFTNTFNRMHPFAYVYMEHLTKLTTLELQNNHVEIVHNEWFKNGPKSLKIIRFVKGNIKRVGYNALNALTNLRVIDLSDNELTYIPRWAFPEPAKYLTEINLERNKFENLPEDFFTDMPSLEKVNLELNEFSTIDETLWKPVWNNLEFLNIDYNPMICDRSIKWIYDTNKNLEHMLIATCYKPFNLMERDLHSLTPEEIK